MKRTTPISEIMTTEVVTLNVADRLETAEKLFKKYKIRHIPVVKDKAVLGMLSYTDLLRISFADVSDDETSIDAFVYDMFSIQQVMARNLFMVAPNSTIKEVAELLSKKEFHALPVVEDNELVGIVTTTDLINYLIAQL
ncbi:MULTISPECIES: CBS domain-containing protein [unclassified Polaribacter]|jgi:CBS domain-containing protein|uniref:CBS domain-containing protein n=1 Tax=unclassified Polaribacter TaxID=196858 RepID=UPI00052C0B74|nr:MULTISPECIES: CBS domain-containing protein [unclassified Polaribacter]KGL59551.1 CBS domain protein-containing protein [Polaribacter sp. Hel1_33_49]PKV64045.1 CBS domain protein [Polaribacter sp. Hel1_33_96]